MRWALVADDPLVAAPTEAPMPGAPGRFHAMMIEEEVWTGDGRIWAADSLTWRDLPLPLTATLEDDHGSMAGITGLLVGQFDRIERQGNQIHGYGEFVNNPDAEQAHLIQMIQDGELAWFSAVTDEGEWELMLDQGLTEDQDDEAAPSDPMMDMFALPEGETEEVGDKTYLVVPMPNDRMRFTQSRLMGGMALSFQAFPNSIIEPDSAAAPLAASAIPVRPPQAWFANPQFSAVTPWTVTDAGEVYGHLAAWDSCHIGKPGCMPPPHSRSNYAHFRTGEVRTAEGTRVAVGQVCLKGGHAELSLSAREAMQHYDDTRSAFADVAVGEDRYGIWVHGALRPGLDPASVRVAMAHDVSGDWRHIGGALDLIGICSVNVPGFMKPRITGYTEKGLVASLTVAQPLQAYARSEDLRHRAVERIAASIGRSHAQRRAALRARVHAGAK